MLSLMEELLPIGEFSARCGLSAKMLSLRSASSCVTPRRTASISGRANWTMTQRPAGTP